MVYAMVAWKENKLNKLKVKFHDFPHFPKILTKVWGVDSFFSRTVSWLFNFHYNYKKSDNAIILEKAMWQPPIYDTYIHSCMTQLWKNSDWLSH